MNIIDLAVVAVLGLGLLIGWYHGSVRAAANVGVLLLSIVIALGFQGWMARGILKQDKVIPQLLYYSESDVFLSDVELSHTPVDSLTAQSLDTLLSGINLPHPMEARLRTNLEKQAFAQDGLTTMGQYLAMTIAHMTVNIASFIAIFAICAVILFIVVRGLDVTFIFPVLRYGDGLVGAAAGLVAATLLLFVMVLLVPIGLSYVPFEELRTMVDKAATGRLFYYSNFILPMMRGIIG